MEIAKQVCAVVDMQGFFIDKVFYPREFAIVNNEMKLCFEIDCEIQNDLKFKSFRHFSFQQNQIHGIPVEKVLNERTSRVFKISELQTLVYEIYCRFRTEDKSYVAIKNQQLAKLLDEYGIPYLNLERENIGNEICPPLHLF